MGMLLEKAWDEYAEKLDEWQQEAGGHPAFVGSLARRYVKIGRFDDAEPLLKKYITLSPDYWAYHDLAEGYKARKDEARWLSTLDEFLVKVEDHGLDHARVRVEIAKSMMGQGRFDERGRTPTPRPRPGPAGR